MRRRVGIAGFLPVLALIAACQSPAAPAFEQVVEAPMYGASAAASEVVALRDRYLASLQRMGVERAEGSVIAAGLGFDYLRGGDYATAMKRFNQAWLLDPENGDSFHGFALVMVLRDRDMGGAEAMFERALASPRVSPGAHADYGRFLLAFQGAPERAVPHLRTAVERDPENGIAHGNLALALDALGEGHEACAEAFRALPKLQEGAQLDAIHALLGKPVCRLPAPSLPV